MIVDDELAQITQTGGDDVKDRRRAGGFRVLDEPRRAQSRRPPHGASVGQEFAGENLQQRRLARAISADDGDPFTGLDEQAGMIQQRDMSERRRHIFESNQRHG